MLTRDATVVLVGARMSANGLGPLPHLVATRLASMFRSQTVNFFLAKIEQEDLLVLREAARNRKGETGDRQALRAERAARRAPVPGQGHARGKIVVTT